MHAEERYGELDALRGIAVLLMVAYHLLFDLAYFYGWEILVREGFLSFLARAIASLFLLLIGTCFMISWERQRATRQQAAFLTLYPKYLRRGLTILSGGLILSLVTWFIAPHAFIKFGILHLIGVSALFQPLFAPLKHWNFFLGFLVLLVFLVLPATTSSPLLFPLGMTYPGFASLDYYPLLPWFGIVLIGMAVGNSLYIPRRRNILSVLGNISYPTPLLWTGKQALWIYFVHQPLLLLLLSITLGMPRG